MPTPAESTQQSLSFMQQATASSKRILAERQATLAQIESQQDSLPSLSSIRELRNQAKELALVDPVKAAELSTQAESLLQQRADWNQAQHNAYVNVLNSEEAVSNNERRLAELQAQATANPNSGVNEAIAQSDQDPISQQTFDNQDTSSGGTPVSVDTYADYDQPPATQIDEFTGIDNQIAENSLLDAAPDISDDELNALYPPPEFDDTPVDLGDSNVQGLTAPKTNTQTQATNQDQTNFETEKDWRVRLSLAAESYYLYNADPSGILQPLTATNGVIFPYTPSVQVNYAASYDATDITHSNYKIFQYKHSSVDSISISCDFTAQDNFEANYLLAVIHFFRTVTKMFYGQDQNPARGTPPPLCYLTGLGAFQFNGHPLAITGFNYSLPTDVDYIRATSTTTIAGVNKSAGNVPNNSTSSTSKQRLTGVSYGGDAQPAQYQTAPSGTVEPTYVPTKMQISITAVPIVSRNDISNRFSLKEYATGNLLRSVRNGSRGIW